MSVLDAFRDKNKGSIAKNVSQEAARRRALALKRQHEISEDLLDHDDVHFEIDVSPDQYAELAPLTIPEQHDYLSSEAPSTAKASPRIDSEQKLQHSSSEQRSRRNQFKRQESISAPYRRSLWGRFRKIMHLIYKKCGLKHLIPALIITLYTFAGALIFMAVERPSDIERRTERGAKLRFFRKQFIAMVLTEVVDNPELDTTQKRSDHVDAGLNMYENEIGFSHSNESEWDFWTGMYFSGTIYTTIGYGDVACHTRWGRLISCIYAIIGIPLMLTTLNDLGIFCFKLIKKTLNSLDHLKIEGSKLVTNIVRGREGRHDQNGGENRKGHPKTSQISDTSRVEHGNASNEQPTETTDDEEEAEIKIPVWAALTVTVGWIFLCSGLFCLWEDWSFSTALYFFFISNSTIGFGDETPAHRQLMIIMFPLVIIGLSLVSMCINVIQLWGRLQELFVSLLVKMLIEYQRRLEEGGDQTNATMGLMDAWSGSPVAKYLMPLLSPEKRTNMMQKFSDDAKAKGIELPSVLQDFNPKTGLPRVLSVVNEYEMEPPLPPDQLLKAHIESSLVKAEEHANLVSSASLPPHSFEDAEVQTDLLPELNLPCMYETGVETDLLVLDDKSNQTDSVELSEMSIQTLQSSFETYDELVQTITADLADIDVQTEIAPTREETSQTHVHIFDEEYTQTETVQTTDEELQTRIVEIVDFSAQIEAAVNVGESQTDAVDLADAEIQTEKRQRKRKKVEEVTFRKSKAIDLATVEESDESDEETETDSSSDEDEEEVEKLAWDPVDGMHAEKQRKVSDLLSMFGSIQGRPPPASTPSTPTSRRISPGSSFRGVSPGGSLSKTPSQTPPLVRASESKGSLKTLGKKPDEKVGEARTPKPRRKLSHMSASMDDEKPKSEAGSERLSATDKLDVATAKTASKKGFIQSPFAKNDIERDAPSTVNDYSEIGATESKPEIPLISSAGHVLQRQPKASSDSPATTDKPDEGTVTSASKKGFVQSPYARNVIEREAPPSPSDVFEDSATESKPEIPAPSSAGNVLQRQPKTDQPTDSPDNESVFAPRKTSIVYQTKIESASSNSSSDDGSRDN